MKAIFYKLVNPADKHSWWKREVEITSFGQFQDECMAVNFTLRTQRICYLYDIKESDDKIMIEQCKELVRQDRLADIYYLVEKMYQIGECERELEQKYKMGTFVKVVHKIGLWALQIKNSVLCK